MKHKTAELEAQITRLDIDSYSTGPTNFVELPMKHKTCDLDGALLDAAVARIEGTAALEHWGAYSTQWSAGGPIIERERMCIQSPDVLGDDAWQANVVGSGGKWQQGPTPLIAAMRAFVASKFGDEVELP